VIDPDATIFPARPLSELLGSDEAKCSTTTEEGEHCSEPWVARIDGRKCCATCAVILLKFVAMEARSRRLRALSKKGAKQ
jgi:hypothetical protein